jgi:Tol biopolymer transport system component
MAISDIPSPENLILPASSPDGRYLAATNIDGDQLLVLNFSTRKWEVLAKTSVGRFVWSADSKFIYFDNGFSADQTIFRVRLLDQKIEKVADLKDFRRVVNIWALGSA